MTKRIGRTRRPTEGLTLVPPEDLTPDKKNPRKPDQARLGLLQLSIQKLGFLMPLFREKKSGLLLSGHQRQTVSLLLKEPVVPVIDIDVDEDDILGINLQFNRLTNDFNAFDTGKGAQSRMNIQQLIEMAETLPEREPGKHFAVDFKVEDVRGLTSGIAHLYDKKSVFAAGSFQKKGIRIPAVVSESGKVVNGVHRVFAAVEQGDGTWPVVRIPDSYADVALAFLNYLSMDFHVDEDFKDLLRAGAFRRVSNNKGLVPKSYRFWANGCRTLLDRDSYTTEYWQNFRQLHGHNILDFGAGLCKVAPCLREKGMNAIDFEPYQVDPETQRGEPDIEYSRMRARQFLDAIADPNLQFDSIFLSAVLNSVPFPEDRLKVLAIVNALCSRQTKVYGTYRHISDFDYEYGGVRTAGFFVFDSEPGVRLGDIASRPKIQKFMDEAEADGYFKRFWLTTEHWKGGNVRYYMLSNPRGPSMAALGQSLDFEFGELPFRNGERMGLAKEARKAFESRLQRKIP